MLLTSPPVEVRPRLWMLGTPEFPVYIHREPEECLVFEGGVSALGPLVRNQLDRLGVDPAAVRQAVITHAHPDHVMAIPVFRQMFPNVAVLASEAAAKTLAVEKAVAFFRKIDGALSASLQADGETVEAGGGPAAAAEPPSRIAVDRVLREGDVVETAGGARFQVFETPGHSDCSLSFYEPQLGVLIISDATGYYLPDDDLIWPNYFADYGAYVASIERLAALDAECLCLSHNAAIRGADAVRDYFQKALAATRSYHERIVSQTRAGEPADKLAAELGAEIHARTSRLPLDFFQKNCALLIKNSLRFAEAQGG